MREIHVHPDGLVFAREDGKILYQATKAEFENLIDADINLPKDADELVFLLTQRAAQAYNRKGFISASEDNNVQLAIDDLIAKWDVIVADGARRKKELEDRAKGTPVKDPTPEEIAETERINKERKDLVNKIKTDLPNANSIAALRATVNDILKYLGI